MLRRSIPGIVTVALLLAALQFACGDASAQNAARPQLGVVLLDPLGLTASIPLGGRHSLALSFGADYFGSPRLTTDYLWHFQEHLDGQIRPYAGPGLAVAFAKGTSPFFSKEPKSESFFKVEDQGRAIGGRAIVGFDYLPRTLPVTFYFEVGPMIPIVKYFDPDIDAGIGARVAL